MTLPERCHPMLRPSPRTESTVQLLPIVRPPSASWRQRRRRPHRPRRELVRLAVLAAVAGTVLGRPDAR